MRRTSLNQGWSFRPQALDRFAEMMDPGADLTPVTLPHDAVIGTERSPDAGPATGYFPGGAWEYRRTLGRSEGDPLTTILEFEAVYRDAVFYGLPLGHSGPWSWSDVVASWSWSGHEGAGVTVEVYAAADEVELLVNGRSLGRQPAGAEHRFKALFETEYEPGELVAVAWRGDEEVGRHVLRSATGTVRLAVGVDRPEIGSGPTDLAFVDLAVVDEAGTIASSRAWPAVGPIPRSPTPDRRSRPTTVGRWP